MTSRSAQAQAGRASLFRAPRGAAPVERTRPFSRAFGSARARRLGRVWPSVRAGILAACLAVMAPLALGGCSGDVGDEFHIDQGTQPTYQDENVRFRTTYYFRTFSICEVPDLGDCGNEVGCQKERDDIYYAIRKAEYAQDPFTRRKFGRYVLQTDSLYRFRMTGKASALFNHVHFESGSLRAAQIDPFGVSVRYDDQNNRFSVAPAEVKQEASRDAAFAEMDKLRALKKVVEADSDGKSEIVGKKIDQAIANQLPDQSAGGAVCPSGKPARRGFQILGPEGYRTFDQDERLVMAMTSDAKPLISLLQGLSERKLSQKSRAPNPQGPLLVERVKAAKALLELERLKTAIATNDTIDSSPKAIARAILKTFNRALVDREPAKSATE